MPHLPLSCVAWLRVKNSSAISHRRAVSTAVRCRAAPPVAYGRAPNVTGQEQLLTCKHAAFALVLCRMAELFWNVANWYITIAFHYGIMVFFEVK